MRKGSLVHNQLAIQRLTFEVQEAEEAVKAMSGSPWIAPALRSKTPETLAQANSVLDRYQQRFGVAVAYLMDASGATIASSNRGDPDSFVGQKYAFRPYFQEAMAGTPGRYFALGVTSKKRGSYASHPVKDPAGKVIGVAVFKMTLDRFQQELKEFDPAFLIDPQGIVFVASRPGLDYHSLWPVAVTDPAGFKAQYGTDRFTPIFSQPIHDEARIEFNGRRYMVTRQNIAEVIAPGWALVNLEPFYPVIIHYRLVGIAAAFILVVLTLVFAGTNLSLREGANRIMASEARFRTMFAAAPEAVFVFDPETRRILGANPFMAQWLGYGPEELVGLEIDQLLETEPLGAGEERPGNVRTVRPALRLAVIGKKMVLWLMWNALRPTFFTGIRLARSCLSGILPTAARPKMRSGRPKNTWKISWKTPPTPSASWTSAAGSSNGIELLSRHSAILSRSLKVNHPLNFMPTAINFKPC